MLPLARSEICCLKPAVTNLLIPSFYSLWSPLSSSSYHLQLICACILYRINPSAPELLASVLRKSSRLPFEYAQSSLHRPCPVPSSSFSFRLASLANKLDSANLSSPTPNTSESELPFPAVKLLVGQYLYVSRRPRFWAWLIVAGLFDVEGHELWHTEIYISHLEQRGWSPETHEFDEGPPPPDWALVGKLFLLLWKCMIEA